MTKLLPLISASSIAFLAIYFVARKFGIDLLSRKSNTNAKNSKRQDWLSQARVNISTKQFWLAVFACSTATFLVVLSLSKTPLLAIVLALAGGYLPYLFISKKRSNLSREIVNAWPEALRDISATISAGHSLSFALSTLAMVGPEAIAVHMARFSTLEKSMGFIAAVETIREEMNDATSDRVFEVLIVAHERGGRVVKEIIDDLIVSTTEDIALAEQLATESVEMKINSRAVVVIPWCVLFLLTLGGGMFREFYRTSTGGFVILIGIVLSAVGIAILARLSRVELEARVFSKVRVDS